ncbi:MAG TPA: NAD(P)/FAD-dependent oxidoreductase [Rhizomicrobium sp.]|nr:NAD(P)/FAD-dependent oxidoreductase [Rhizomicrobium sp.]
MADTSSYDVVIIGAGFSGLYMLHKVRAQGLTARVYEAGEGVGGTWYWNRYPGARVDIESQEYSYSFDEKLELEWEWSERYASQPELLKYVNHVADRFDLRRDIQFKTKVLSTIFDEAAKRWTVTTDHGDKVSAKFCVMATGCLSVPKDVDVPGADNFKGPVYRTSRWPHEGVDFTGMRVAVIGTGSSAIQSIPQIAKQASQMTVFQRTPNFSLPANNGPANKDVVADWKANRAERREAQRNAPFASVMIKETDVTALSVSEEDRRKMYEQCWDIGGFSLLGAYGDLITDIAANDTAADFAREKIRALIKDPKVADKLLPRNHPIATKRPCVDIGYFETYNRDNVELVDVNEDPIVSITADSVKTRNAEYKIDALVLAIGFDAMTGALNAIDIRGRGGMSLKEKWHDGPRNYLGLMVAGFPNMFIVTGPGSPSVLTNMMVSIEQHVEWISGCIAHVNERQASGIEATETAEDEWVLHVNEVGNTTLYPLANSWYMGANVPGKPRVFMPYIGGFGVYRQKCNEVAANGYEGFELSSA